MSSETDKLTDEAIKHLEASRWPEAYATLQQISKISATEPQIERLLAISSFNMGAHEVALGHLALVWATNSADAEIFQHMFSVLHQKGDRPAQRAVLERLYHLRSAKELLPALDELRAVTGSRYRDLNVSTLALEPNLVSIEFGAILEPGSRVIFNSEVLGSLPAIRLGARSRLLGEIHLRSAGAKLNLGESAVVADARLALDAIVDIGSRVTLGQGCLIVSGASSLDSSHLEQVSEDQRKALLAWQAACAPVQAIRVHKDAVVGSNVVLLGGAVVEDGAMVAPGSVVANLVAAGTVASGVVSSFV